jgi:hypothetical protein
VIKVQRFQEGRASFRLFPYDLSLKKGGNSRRIVNKRNAYPRLFISSSDFSFPAIIIDIRMAIKVKLCNFFRSHLSFPS